MDSNQFGGIVRAILAYLAGFLPATFLNADAVSAIIGGVVMIAMALWSYYTNKPPATPPTT